jgi:DNA-binding transcriptional MerR regulator
VPEEHHVQIGDVAERVGLSLRTIRYYEEIGLVVPSGRTDGGFRLYREEDIERLQLVKALKPLGMPLEDLQELLALGEGSEPLSKRKAARLDRLLEESSNRVAKLGRRLAAARTVLDGMHAAARERTRR